MQSSEKTRNLLLSADLTSYPPVHQWNPPFCGDIDIVIKANGEWYHDGIKFTRNALMKLFSRLLKKEGDDYFLVTPVEKLKIKVEDAPFLITKMDFANDKIILETLTEDLLELSADHPLIMRALANKNELRPYVLVRSNMEALVHRNVFYEFVNRSVEYNGKHGVWSGSVFFPLE